MMTDVLFGAQSGAPVRPPSVPAGIPRPSPRTLEGIVQRVVQRTGSFDREDTIRATLLNLTDAMFSGRQVIGGLDGMNRLGDEGSQLMTARSSVRSRSTTSEDIKQELNVEVRGLLTELCGVLFSG